jgi:hypothetical protein
VAATSWTDFLDAVTDRHSCNPSLPTCCARILPIRLSQPMMRTNAHALLPAGPPLCARPPHVPGAVRYGRQRHIPMLKTPRGQQGALACSCCQVADRRRRWAGTLLAGIVDGRGKAPRQSALGTPRRVGDGGSCWAKPGGFGMIEIRLRVHPTPLSHPTPPHTHLHFPIAQLLKAIYYRYRRIPLPSLLINYFGPKRIGKLVFWAENGSIQKIFQAKEAQSSLQLDKSSPKRKKNAEKDFQNILLAKTDRFNKYFRRPKRRQWAQNNELIPGGDGGG